MSDTHFVVGDKLVAKSSHQGLVKGNEYTVLHVNERCTMFGNFVTYELMPDDGGEMLAIVNAHVLLSLV
jgi:hypothetical protein